MLSLISFATLDMYMATPEPLKNLKISESLHADAKSAAAKLRVPLAEFIRRAVARELQYNSKKKVK